ncbi:murein hydrolase activator EnvC family protein [Stutzerimonas frequens]|jgi:septal ring factor EnvC (AmiA/AmiB activator)|uniref:murein hydrolase activator EnvC family protein n=1 Tax=Stutzerimonas frequens TaxID=2968969 RepID=UPI0007B806DC|nr:murein hydrolase activator EnvC [Stutzerimonas frequens]WCR46325.1 murein hydrolase activator EnvC [Stutzerimonas stutzeri]KZX61377.1 peptidase M23 [Stutzerimonas frequens]MBK3759799.1 peptidoglycan DD-metalloendopeptidase family protein [Stutzerimonas frequens]MDA0427208.1 murein hydrolase activator EnvC [Stutzerimonas frequens]MDL0438710.1 murein hydrolase activator EnvC [Stutzerimonas frequens]
MPRTFLALAFLCLLGPAVADERAAARQQIEAARQDIAELQKLLKQIEQEKSGVQKQLQTTESEMGQLEKQVDSLQQEIDRSEAELERLNEEKTTLEGARLEQQRLIGLQARAAYQNGRQEYLKLLLNQQNPEKFSRTLTYYDYLNKARLEQLDSFNETLRQLANVEADIEAQQNLLAEKKDGLLERRNQLAEVRKERQQTLAKLNSDLSTRERKLQARRQEQAQFERVLKTIEETLARQAREAEEARQRELLAERQRQQQRQAGSAAPSGPMVSSAGSSFGGPFAQAKGKLPWPVDGRLVARYGTPRGGDARTKWDGVLIGASAGTQVRAVHGGRVVFADWLRGAGLLVILDHGNGYLSLYGHNQSLLRDAGEIVKAGDPIATVGTSGGQETAALYFAIRQQGRPSDPAQWCRTQG